MSHTYSPGATLAGVSRTSPPRPRRPEDRGAGLGVSVRLRTARLSLGGPARPEGRERRKSASPHALPHRAPRGQAGGGGARRDARRLARARRGLRHLGRRRVALGGACGGQSRSAPGRGTSQRPYKAAKAKPFSRLQKQSPSRLQTDTPSPPRHGGEYPDTPSPGRPRSQRRGGLKQGRGAAAQPRRPHRMQ